MWLPSTCLSLLFSSFVHIASGSIWPEPRSISKGLGVIWIEQDVNITYSSGNCTISQCDYAENIIQEAVMRTLEKIFTHNFVPWKFYPRNEIAKFEPEVSDYNDRVYVRKIAIAQTGSVTEKTLKPLAGEVDESYSISISENGTTQISAGSFVGILYALETFSQLFYQHSTGAGIYTNLAPVVIEDAPRFPYRGLNLDVARNWYPVEDILTTISALADNKFNRLHIHMTDSQSWPMEIPSLPDLAKKGAYSSQLVYSPEDITRIQAFAMQRGVQVIIEIDIPGHSASIARAYPELIAGYSAKPWITYCAEPPCGSLKLNSTATNKFLEKLFMDVLPRISPYSPYLHTGGDEVNKQVYLLDDTVKSNDSAVLQPLIQEMVNRVHVQLRASGVTPIVWEEMALEWNLTLGPDVVVQTWISDKSVAAATAKGYQVLVGSYDYWYFDCGNGQWLNFENGPSFQRNFPFEDYCSPVKNWRKVYSYDPLSGVPPAQHHLVLGGEVHAWSEQIDPINLQTTLWPRTSAAGEILWSGRQGPDGQNRSQIIAGPRLAEWRERMIKRGIRSGPVQMIHCTQLGGVECSL